MEKEVSIPQEIRPVIGNRGRQRHDVPDSPLLERAQKWILHHDMELVHGPAEVSFEKDEMVVLVVLRDGRPYIKSFVEHHFALGAKHLVFLDNGSEDGTIEALQRYESGVTVFKTGLPFRHYQISMRQYLVERFGKGRWTLSVDIDELFDYPFSDVVSLKALLGYLNERRYTAVVTQMLDMFPEEISSESAAVAGDEPLEKLHRYYDTSNVSTHDYKLFAGFVDNEVSNEEIQVLQGGVQRRLFDLSPLLTKHPLVFLEEGVRPIDLSEHWVGGARLADFTGLLKHYKLSASLYGLVRREVEKRTYPNRHGKYDKYLKVLESDSRLELKDESSRELSSTDELLGSHFMVVSREYMGLVGKEAGRSEHSGEQLSRLTGALLHAGSGARGQARSGGDGRARRRNDNAGQWQAENRAEWAREQTRRAQERAANAHEQFKSAQEHAERLKEQIRAVQSSKAWKLIQVLSRVKKASRGFVARLREGAERLPDVKEPLKKPSRTLSQNGDKQQERQGPRKPEKTEASRTVFFIVGSGKSGTTWLMRMLNAHPEILCRGEGRFFNREWHREDLRHTEAKVPPRTLYGALCASEDLRLWVERSPWGSGKNTEEFIAGTTRAVMDHIFDRWLAESNLRDSPRQIIGDKTPFLPGANVIEEIAAIYPEAKVLHIIRDGRDVEVSWVHHRWNRATDRGGVQVLSPGEVERREAYENDHPQRLAELGMFEEEELRRRAGLWREQVGGAAEAGPRLLGENYVEVRYESMLEDSASELEWLLEFLGASSDEESVRHCVETASFEALSGGRQRGEEDAANFYRKGIAGDWKNTFTEKDRRIYREAAGDLLAKFGYEN